MKRKRETERSDMRSAIDELSMLSKLKPVDNRDHENDDDARYIPTMVFLSICNFLLQVLGNFLFFFFFLHCFASYIIASINLSLVKLLSFGCDYILWKWIFFCRQDWANNGCFETRYSSEYSGTRTIYV